jgi:hypothetical protein
MYILGYDVASKSLALTIIYFNENWEIELQKIKNLFNDKLQNVESPKKICEITLQYIDRVDELLDTIIIPILFDVVDLIPNQKVKDTSVILRASRLKSYLLSVDQYLSKLYTSSDNTYKILLEYQMGPNDKSRNVCSQILYHYSNTDFNFNSALDLPCDTLINKYDVEIIGPSLKNKINMDIKKPYAFFINKYTKAYDANKAHSKNNFIYWVDKKNISHMIKNVKKKNLDDIADSCNMILAWIFLKSKLI